jgi:hypothetical protein
MAAEFAGNARFLSASLVPPAGYTESPVFRIFGNLPEVDPARNRLILGMTRKNDSGHYGADLHPRMRAFSG